MQISDNLLFPGVIGGIACKGLHYYLGRNPHLKPLVIAVCLASTGALMYHQYDVSSQKQLAANEWKKSNDALIEFVRDLARDYIQKLEAQPYPTWQIGSQCPAGYLNGTHFTYVNF
jgi:hypothetical protein